MKESKVCSGCKREQPATAYAKRSPNKYGKVYLRSKCKECQRNELIAFRATHVETEAEKQRQREYNRRWQAKQQALARLAKEAIAKGLIKVKHG